MARRFDCFVILAAMRTGSNFLEANLNVLSDVRCHGEAFNPNFLGQPGATELLGVSERDRDADPGQLIDAIRADPAHLGGFRYFPDHDSRILDAVLADPACAKVVLSRNPLDSYISRQIAETTGQWRLMDPRRRRAARPRFDAQAFQRDLAEITGFRAQIDRRLQETGQTAFRIDYDDLGQIDVINGLAAWLGVSDRLTALDRRLKPQNPDSAVRKVANPDEMRAALREMDPFSVDVPRNAEPARGAGVPRYIAASRSTLLYLPVPGCPDTALREWLAALDGARPAEVTAGFDRRTLRRWKRTHPGFRSFTILQHPVARAFAAFHTVTSAPPERFAALRQTLSRRFGVDKVDGPAPARRVAFERFLDFLSANLAGQTAFRIDPIWGTQAQALSGMATLAPPDMVLREGELADMLPWLARRVGHPSPPTFGAVPIVGLEAIYDAGIEARIADIYHRDYVSFGFDSWSKEALGQAA
jgi:LPS sulfotransferase NodH